jgi:hypothetical protein
MTTTNEELNPDDLATLARNAAELIAERRASVRPTRCSQCLGGADRGMFLTQRNEHEVMLCSLRCLALWALARGWPIR